MKINLSISEFVPCFANTVGPGLFLEADYALGGCDGALGRGMGWQGMSFLTTLHYGPTRHITSTYIPTRQGRLCRVNCFTCVSWQVRLPRNATE